MIRATSKGSALVKADDLLQQNRPLSAGAGEQITFLSQRIARELQTLPRPN